MPITLKYYIALFVPFFLLFYSESISVGSLSISQLWKLPLVGYLIYYLFQYRRKATPLWSSCYYWLSTKCLVNAGTFKNIFGNVIEAIPFLFLPLIYNFCNTRFTKEKLQRVCLLICQFFVLTNIPFLFLGMESRGRGVDFGDFVGYSGIFQNQHAMTVIMSLCIIVILNWLKNTPDVKFPVRIYNCALILLALYALYLGFARTGWLMCLLGVVILFMPKNMKVREWMSVVLLGLVLSGGMVYMLAANEDFYNRIMDVDTRTHRQKDFGSGRVEYIGHAVDLYKSGNPLELAFGKCMDDLTDYEYEMTGMHIYAHNGFITLLATNGAIGLLLKLFAMGSLLGFIYRRRQCESFRPALAMWMMNLSFQMTQGGHAFHFDLIYAMIFCTLQLEYEEQAQ